MPPRWDHEGAEDHDSGDLVGLPLNAIGGGDGVARLAHKAQQPLRRRAVAVDHDRHLPDVGLRPRLQQRLRDGGEKRIDLVAGGMSETANGCRHLEQ
ncbi:hypothetical protein GCM10027568_13620 [Humibacter soli]